MDTTTHHHPKSYDIALLILRLAVGVIFVAHGLQKLTQVGFAGVSGMLESMGVPAAGVLGPALALGELLGGLGLLVGLLTRVAAAGLAIDMLGAMLLVHLPAGFFLPEGIEFALALLAANVAFLVAGAGRYSIDALIGRRPHERATVPADEAAARRRVA